MIYTNIHKAKFLSRPNRFIANIEIDGKNEIARVKNTGRCKELLLQGSTVLVQEFDTVNRKTKYDLISVYKGNRLINIDSHAPNKVFNEWMQAGYFLKDITFIKPEITYQNSRFDFYIENECRKIFVELKGVTLEENGVVMFPDAPTQRGVKHIEELCNCVEHGYEAYMVFIVQMSNVKYFTTNDNIHRSFGSALRLAQSSGVNVLAFDCNVSEDSIVVNNNVKISL